LARRREALVASAGAPRRARRGPGRRSTTSRAVGGKGDKGGVRSVVRDAGPRAEAGEGESGLSGLQWACGRRRASGPQHRMVVEGRIVEV
jgi:hypothetical protein